MKLIPIDPSELNAKQKKNYRFQKWQHCGRALRNALLTSCRFR